jgi:DUF1365 family protein
VSEESALYFGSVFHRRLGPTPHRFRYRLFWLFLDLDELDALSARLKLFSYNRFNLFSLHDRDHGDALSLRAQALALLEANGVKTPIGAIRLLTMPRTLGYDFNPLSVYFCYGADGAVAALIYEVRNTFGGRHSYVAPAGPPNEAARHACDKTFFVSPFLPMGLRYEFQAASPGPSIMIAIRAVGSEGVALRAALAGERRRLTDGALLKVALTVPLVPLKTMAAIHWQALRLLMKGVRYRGPGAAAVEPSQPRSIAKSPTSIVPSAKPASQ